MPRWTEEARKKQSQAIRRWKPWEQSTGPRTESGKTASARNSTKDELGILIKHSRGLFKANLRLKMKQPINRVFSALYYKNGNYCYFPELRSSDERICDLLRKHIR